MRRFRREEPIYLQSTPGNAEMYACLCPVGWFWSYESSIQAIKPIWACGLLATSSMHCQY